MRDEPEPKGAEKGAMLRVNDYHHAEHRTTTLDQIREFVEGSRTIGFPAPKREAVYEFIERVLKSQQYRRLGRGQKGSVRRFLVKTTGLSRAQLTRWIGRWMKTRRVQRKPACRPSLLRCGHCGAKLLAQYPGPRVIRYQCSGTCKIAIARVA